MTKKNEIQKLNFFDEDGNNISTDFLNEMFDLAIDEEDFVNKVTCGCTNEYIRLDEVTENNLYTFYFYKGVTESLDNSQF